LYEIPQVNGADKADLSGKIQLAKIGERSEKTANFILPIFKVWLVAGANYMPLFLFFAKETKPKHPLKSKTENNKYKYTR